MMARVNYVGNTSLVIGIKVTSEDIKQKHVKHTNTSYFTMVAKDGEKLVTVPPLLLENRDDVRRFAEQVFRKRLKKHYQGELSKAENNELSDYLELCKDERCIVAEDLS